jgi:hypothetical protein
LVKLDLRKSLDSKKSIQDLSAGKRDKPLTLPHRILRQPSIATPAAEGKSARPHLLSKNVLSKSPLTGNNDGELKEEEFSKYSSNFKQRMEVLGVEQVLSSESRSYLHKVKERVKELLRKCCPSYQKPKSEIDNNFNIMEKLK